VAAGKPGFTVIQYRDAMGCGRNLAIEVLEYFDAIGYTSRQGDRRSVRTNHVPEELFSG
jgi:selenocysteine-specific elongation factor